MSRKVYEALLSMADKNNLLDSKITAAALADECGFKRASMRGVIAHLTLQGLVYTKHEEIDDAGVICVAWPDEIMEWAGYNDNHFFGDWVEYNVQ
jgi:hypothetical protein